MQGARPDDRGTLVAMGGRVHAPTIESRALFLLPAGALLVHQLRYLLAYGPGADSALSAQGHAYLG